MSYCRYSNGHFFSVSLGKFLAAERSSCLGTVLSTKLFAQTEARSIFWRINEPEFYLNIDYLPQTEQTDYILKTSPLLLRKVPTVYVESEKTRMQLAYEENAFYEY